MNRGDRVGHRPSRLVESRGSQPFADAAFGRGRAVDWASRNVAGPADGTCLDFGPLFSNNLGYEFGDHTRGTGTAPKAEMTSRAV